MSKKFTMCSLLMLTVIAFSLWSPVLYAGLGGKIAGKVVDVETGEALLGANIVVEGQSLGAATDINGEYFILNVPPGTYSLKVSTIGYTSKIISGVRVNVDKTTKIDISLKSSVIETKAVTVRAAREVVNLDVSGTRSNLTVEEIQARPATAMQEVLAMQPGVAISHSAQNGTGLSIRGGGVDETGFQMNGISLKDQTTNVAFMELPQSAIKEIQILTGGFSAEYGGVRSGIVNVITKEGSLTEYENSIDVKITPAQQKHFGPSAYDKNGRIWQVFAGAKAFTGTTASDVAEFDKTNGASGYPFEFRGWNAIAADLIKDGNPNNNLTPQEALDLWKRQHRPIAYGNKPDYDIDASFSGPVPFSIFGKKVSFLAAVKLQDQQFPYPLSRDGEITQVYLGKLTTQLTKELKLSVDNVYGFKKGCSIGSSDDIGVISGSFWGPVAATAGGARSSIESAANAFSYSSMYNQGASSLRDDYMYRLNAELTYVFSPSTFSTFRYQYGRNWVSSGHMSERSSANAYQIGDKWYDETPEGWSSSLGSYDLTKTFAMQGGGERYNRSNNWFHTLQLDVTSQLDRYDQAKAGAGVTFSTIHTRSAVFWLPTYETYESTPWFWQHWDANPTTGYLYAQDKLEFEGMIANVGLRADFMDPNSNCYQLSSVYDTYYNPQNFSVGTTNDVWFTSKKTEKAEVKVKLQPRVGVSFPVSHVGKIYFNYGHFYQAPDYYRMYSPGVTSGGSAGFLVPNPNLDWPRTIQYEIGYEHSLADMFLIRAAGYYKDISGQFMMVEGIDWDETVKNEIWTNNEYADIRGVELSFNKPYGDYVTFWTNFNYQVSTSGVTSLNIIYENPIKAEEQKYNVTKVEPIPSISYSAGITLTMPDEWGIATGLSATILYSFDDGGKTLFNPEAPTDQQHYIECANYTNTDLQIQKSFTVNSKQFEIYVNIFNLFDQKHLYTGGFTQAEYQNYKNSLKVPWGVGDKKGNDKWGDYPHDGKQTNIDIGWRNWNQFLNPRSIDIGIRFKL
jgi:outer membrane receptor protein involved in Fe transport